MTSFISNVLNVEGDIIPLTPLYLSNFLIPFINKGNVRFCAYSLLILINIF